MLDKTYSFLNWVAQVEGVNDGASHGLFSHARDEVQHLRSLPEVICLAGSARFKLAFEEEEERLALAGCIVLGKHVFKPGAKWDRSDRERDLLHAVQFRKVDLSHRVHIVNVDGYVGQDTYNLIRYAMRVAKPITFREQEVRLLADGQKVTAHHFLRATYQRVQFEEAAFSTST